MPMSFHRHLLLYQTLNFIPMPWFKRTDKGILTPTESKREVPDGLWFKSPENCTYPRA